MKRKDFISGVVLFLVGCGICGYALRTSLGTITQPGAGFFGFLTGAAISIFSLITLFRGWRLPKPGSSEGTKESVRWRNIILLCLGVLAYSYGLEFLGYLIATLLLMIFLFRTIEPQPWWVVLLGGVSTTLISYLLFQVWLKIDLPIGFLGI
jgi:putative tricarboxylic transport membrane protein